MPEFQFIPAVDLLDGKVVRLHQGRYDAVTVYGEDPAVFLRQFIEEGARLIHIVDLNAARNGDRNANRKAVNGVISVLSEFDGRLEIGGGIRSMDALGEYFDRGISRCILGTSAVSDPDFLMDSVEKFGPKKIIAGVDAKEGRVKIAGWEKDGGVTVDEFLPFLESVGIEEIIYTDIATDGAMTGPSFVSLGDVISSSDLRVIASGGVSSVEDVIALLEFKMRIEADFEHDRLIGAISGRAVYEGQLSVSEAVFAIQNEL